MVYITRRERFNAAHKLFREDWSQEENTAIFGKCANPNWHGHNYELFVTVKGEINPATGRCRKVCPPGTIRNEKGVCTKEKI